jgi:hypothetical protein
MFENNPLHASANFEALMGLFLCRRRIYEINRLTERHQLIAEITQLRSELFKVPYYKTKESSETVTRRGLQENSTF